MFNINIANNSGPYHFLYLHDLCNNPYKAIRKLHLSYKEADITQPDLLQRTYQIKSSRKCCIKPIKPLLRRN